MAVKHQSALTILVVAGMLAFGTQSGTALAPQNTQTGASQRAHNIAAGEAEARKLLLLMDKDQNGKVSRQEFMSFMEAEFDRLDENQDGELDVKELTRSQLATRTGHTPRR